MRFETQGRHDTLPSSFRPADPSVVDEDLEALKGMRVLVTRRDDRAGVIGGCQRIRSEVRCFVVTEAYSAWLPVEDLEPDLSPPPPGPDEPTPVGLDVFG